MQANAAAKQHCPLARGTHAKGVCARAQFEVFDVRDGRDPKLAARLAKGIFARPGSYPATIRFANSDPNVNSDFKADVRSLSIAVDLTRDGTLPPAGGVARQDFSLQNAHDTAAERRAGFCRHHEGIDRGKAAQRSLVAAAAGQTACGANARLGTVAGGPADQAVSAATLLEHGAIPSRRGGGGEAVGDAGCGQSVETTATAKPRRVEGRTGSTP